MVCVPNMSEIIQQTLPPSPRSPPDITTINPSPSLHLNKVKKRLMQTFNFNNIIPIPTTGQSRHVIVGNSDSDVDNVTTATSTSPSATFSSVQSQPVVTRVKMCDYHHHHHHHQSNQTHHNMGPEPCSRWYSALTTENCSVVQTDIMEEEEEEEKEHNSNNKYDRQHESCNSTVILHHYSSQWPLTNTTANNSRRNLSVSGGGGCCSRSTTVQRSTRSRSCVPSVIVRNAAIILSVALLHVIHFPLMVVCGQSSVSSASASASLLASSSSSSSPSLSSISHQLLQPSPTSQYMAPSGCEWSARFASNQNGEHGDQHSVYGDLSALHSSQSSPITSQTSSSSSSSTLSEMMLTCRLRTLNGALDSGVNLSLLPTERTYGLSLTCEDVLFESTLTNRSFERMHQLRELRIEKCKLSELPADVLFGLNELRQLTLRTRDGEWGEMGLRLPPAVFMPVRRLEQLDLSSNGLSVLSPALFCPLSRLQFLNVSDNKFEEVASLGFSAKIGFEAITMSECRRLESISHLDLSFNNIKVLTDRGFGRLNRLQVLNLSYNKIVRAEETSLTGLAELSKLDLSHNQLVALPSRFFDAVKTTLVELHLRNNSFSVIAPGLFSGMNQVTVLDLSKNEITSHWVNPATFSEMSRLVTLDLSSNKLTRVDTSAFRSLFTLQSLLLNNNEIESLAENAFAANRNLHTLSLSGNRLTTLDAASFSGLDVLNALSLEQNRILHIHPAAFANISGLMELNLGQNRLESVPIAIASLHSLRTLDLSYNRIREISNASYRGLEQLYGLNVEGNVIGNLSRNDFLDLPNLRVLNLASNRIMAVEQGTFDNVPDLHALRLDSNGLIDINGLFANLRDMLMLNISANHITLFDYALIPVGLQWLDIHDNQITHLGNYFDIEAELKLRTLDASMNKILEIEASSLPDGIELVLLNRNEIRKVAPFTFLKKGNLTRVDLSENKLTTMDLNALRLNKVPARKPMPEFTLSGNPFQCDCNMEWLQRAAIASMPGGMALPAHESRQYPRLVDATLATCRLSFGRGLPPVTPLLAARSSQFLCSYRSHCFALCHCCEFDACDCEMTCPDNCTCFYDQSWNTNIVDCGTNQHGNVPNRIPMDVTDLYLDGNIISELSPHTFIGRKNLRHLHLNSSHIHTINNRTFNGLKALLVLNLADNQLDTLYGYEFERLTDLRELYLQHNRISTIANRTFTALRSLRILRLDHNRIIEFELWTGLTYNTHLTELYIGTNDWSCECHFVGQLLEWLPLRSEVVKDLPSVHCQYNDTYALPLAPVTLTETNSADIESARANISAACSHYARRELIAAQATTTITGSIGGNNTSIEEFLPVIGLVAGSTFTVLLLLGIIVTAVLYRHELKVWFFARTGVRLNRQNNNRPRRKGDPPPEDNEEKLFDAFVSYSKKDEAFVTQLLAPELEFGPNPLRLCLHYRDLPIGSGFVSDAIVEAMNASKRSIMIISEHFLRNEWCHFEFKTAHQEALSSRQRVPRMILIFVGPVSGKDLDPDIRVWLKLAGNTCLQWGEKMFWEKLRYAMPEIPASGNSNSSATSSSSTGSSSSYGRKGQAGKGNTLPALTTTSLSHAPLASSGTAIDSYGHHSHLQHIPPGTSQLSVHHPLLSGSMHTTLGRYQSSPHQQSNSALYSPSSIHSQQSTYAYPTYHPAMHNAPGPSGMMSRHSTPPPLPPAHPLHTQLQLHHQSQHSHHQLYPSGSGSASTTATSLESGPPPPPLPGMHPHSHHHHHHSRHSTGGGSSSAESASLVHSGSSSQNGEQQQQQHMHLHHHGGQQSHPTLRGGHYPHHHQSQSHHSGGGGGGGGGGGQVPFVPSASSTIAVHI